MTLVARSSPLNHQRPALVLVVLLWALIGCEPTDKSVRLEGSIFGTSWSLVYVPEEVSPESSVIEASVLEAFEVVDSTMNTYVPDTALSRFNQMPVGEVIEMGWDFAYLVSEAQRITRLSDGAYDVTVGPLLDLWGFGPQGPKLYPSEQEVEAAKAVTGWSLIAWNPTNRLLSKRQSGVEIELSSIAKGYAVDLGADALDELGIENFLLEVGGEMQARGVSPRGDHWRVAIERPEMARSGVQAALSVTDVGIATSGDYRNYFEVDGVRYSHLIDPRTGYPIRHDLVSVTVIHPSTAIADAWATAMAVMGSEASLALAEARHMAIYVIRRSGDTLSSQWSSEFDRYLESSGGGSE